MHFGGGVHLMCTDVIKSKQKAEGHFRSVWLEGHSHRDVIITADLGSAFPVLHREPRKAPAMF